MLRKRNTKIIATLGPSSSEEEKLRKLIENGLDVVRLNMSHGNIEDHKERFELVRRVDETIPIIIDLSGPKIRIGEVKENFDLIKDDTIILTKENVVGNREKLSISYNELIENNPVYEFYPIGYIENWFEPNMLEEGEYVMLT